VRLTSDAAEERQDANRRTHLLGGEADGSSRVGARPGMAAPDDGVEDHRGPPGTPVPLLVDDLRSGSDTAGDGATTVEPCPVPHVALRAAYLHPRERQADGAVLVRDEGVLGSVERQDRHGPSATELELDGHRGHGSDPALTGAGIDDRERGPRRKAGGEDRAPVDAIGVLEGGDQLVDKGGIRAVGVELPFRLRALGARDGHQVTGGRSPGRQTGQRGELRRTRAEPVEEQDEGCRPGGPVRPGNRQLVRTGDRTDVQGLVLLPTSGNRTQRRGPPTPGGTLDLVARLRRGGAPGAARRGTEHERPENRRDQHEAGGTVPGLRVTWVPPSHAPMLQMGGSGSDRRVKDVSGLEGISWTDVMRPGLSAEDEAVTEETEAAG